MRAASTFVNRRANYSRFYRHSAALLVLRRALRPSTQSQFLSTRSFPLAGKFTENFVNFAVAQRYYVEVAIRPGLDIRTDAEPGAK